MAYLTINDAKKHCNIDQDFTDDDYYVDQLIQAAETSLALRINDDLADHVTDGKLAEPLMHALRFMVGQWYAHREPVSNINVYVVPYTLDDLISEYINHTVK